MNDNVDQVIEDVYPLTPLQQGLLFHALMAPDSGVYVEQLRCTLEASLNVGAFEQALQILVDRHAVLRSAFIWQELDAPVQVVYRKRDIAITRFDWRGGSQAGPQLESFLTQDRQQGFDLGRAPLLRFALIRVSDSTYEFIWTCHHILYDGWSFALLMRELLAAYAAFSKNQAPALAPTRPYRDYIAWLTRQELTQAETYWRNALAGLPAPTSLTADRRYPDRRGYGEQECLLDAERTQSLNALARRHGFTMNTLIQGAWAILLSRYSQQSDVVFGATVSGRPPEIRGIESMIGLFINSLPVRARVDRDAILIDWLASLQAQNAELRQFEFTPLTQIHAWSEMPGGTSLFESLVVFENYPIDDSVAQADQTLPIRRVHMSEQTHYPLTLTAWAGQRLSIKFSYQCQRFDDLAIARLIGHFQTLLAGMVDDPRARIGELPMLSAQEHRQILVHWNDTARDYARDQSLAQLFEAQVQRTPQAMALVFGEQALSYGELNARANRLAHRLRRLGVGPDVPVGLCLERSLEMVVGLLGILKAGGAYVPLDPSYPKQRLAYMLQDAKPAVLLTQAALCERLPELPASVPVLCLDRDWGGLQRESKKNPRHQTLAAHLAYVIYTSGSTGRPKGVMVTHGSLINLLADMRERVGFAAQDVLLPVTSLSFDIAALELFLPLIAGARAHLITRAHASDGAQLAQALQHSGATLMQATPATWGMVAAAALPKGLTLLCGGEALPAELARRLLQHADSKALWNVYGPSETTIWSSAGRIDPADLCLSIGRPIANTQIYLLDAQLQPLPVGVAGELYIAGAGLARGYLQRPGLSAEKFIPNPFSSEPGARMYRSGDRARYLPDGNIDFLGRIDHQVKLRGFRIELGEIEAALGQLPAVREAVVLAREDTPGDKRLVAYVRGQPGAAAPDAAQLRLALQHSLPQYMIPAHFVVLEQLPLTPNGKVDRKALPAPDAQGSAPGYVAPHTPTQVRLAALWAEVLQRQGLGIHDNFFELGGHSLLATQVISKVRSHWGVELALRTLFEAPSVAALAQQLDSAQAAQAQRTAPPILPLQRSGPLPLSFAQQRLWFLDQLQPGNALYNLPATLRLRGELERPALVQTFNEIVRRHEALRTGFHSVEGKPVQVLAAELEVALPLSDVSHLPEPEREAQALRLAEAEAMRPFDLAAGPLLRAGLIRLGERDHILLVTLHHIVADGWSMGVLMQECAALYSAYAQGLSSPLPRLELHYADFAQWQRQWLQGAVLEQQLRYWKEQLAGAPEVLELPTDRPRPGHSSYRGGRLDFHIDPATCQGLRALAQGAQGTLFMVLAAAFNVLLYRYSGQEDICIGTPIANRNRAEIEPLIGFFVNTLVLRTRLQGQTRFTELLQQVRSNALGAYTHQDVPFEHLVDELKPERHLSHAPLFQVMLVLQNAPMPALELPGLQVQGLDSQARMAKFDLTLSLEEDGAQGLRGQWEYSSDLFNPQTIAHMAAHLQGLLAAILSDPGARIGELPMLSAQERSQILVHWNDTARDYARDQSLAQLFEAQVQRTPQAMALVFGEQALSYGELNARANRLAHQLRRLGVGPDVRVGLCLERSLEMVVGLLGVLKAGGAYVPLDPSYPKERLAYMLQDAKPAVLLTQGALCERLPEPAAGMSVLCLDRDGDKLARESSKNPKNRTLAAHLAYVIYTSGSTGRPKGVAIDHAGIVNRLLWMQEAYRLTEADRVLQKTPFSFDVSVWEFFWPLITGSALVVAKPQGHQDPRYLAELISRQAITTVHFVPPMLESFLHALDALPCPTLKRIICSGEALPSEVQQRCLRQLGQAALHNLYGPTEASVDVTFWQCQPNTDLSFVPIGRPIANTQIYLLDARLQPVPVGVPGELYIAGAGLARGYLQRPGLSAARFLPNPFSPVPGARMYRSGDLARYLPDGNIEFLGRLDHQVKIRGFRIELGEIEAALGALPAVREAVVVAREDAPGDKRLVAYVLGEQDAAKPAVAQLRLALQRSLPEYMIPAHFVLLEQLPLTPNGKVDRKALPAPETRASALGYVAPHTATQARLAGIWTQILKHEPIGVHDNFFELGGHSLLATQVISKIRSGLALELPLRTVFDAPTLGALAQHIDAAQAAQAGPSAPPIVPIAPLERSGPLPLSFAQQRLWFLDQFQPGSASYNIPAALRLKGTLDIDALRRTVNEIIRRHEVLRTTFNTVDGGVVQVIAPELQLPLEVEDLGSLSDSERESEALRRTEQEAKRPFSLSQGPLARARLLRLGEQDHVLSMTLHHIVSDGWSMGVLVHEVCALYAAFTQDRSSPLPELPIQYADFAFWQRQWLQGETLERQLSYWRERLQQVPVLALPCDHPRPPVQRYRGAAENFDLSAQRTQELQALSRAEGATLFMTLLAAFNVLLYRYTDQVDMCVGSPIANRNRGEIEPLIGFFVNTLALRTDLTGDPPFRVLLGRVRETALEAYAHQDVPFEKLVEELAIARDLSRAPLFQVLFVLQNAPAGALTLPGLTLTPVEASTHTAKFDLTLSIVESPQGLRGTFIYNSDLFEASTIHRMMSHFQTLLTGIVADPARRLSQLPLMSPAERHQILAEWNATQTDFPRGQTLPALFEAQVERSPDAIALVFGEQGLSYGELNARANRLAHQLRRLGVGPDVRVGLCLERSLEMVVGLLGVLKAGGAYVPLDPSYPKERLAYMLQDAKPAVLLTQGALCERLPEPAAGMSVLCLDRDGDKLARESSKNPKNRTLAAHLAYVIYTSGSTGRPKGVAIDHAGIVNRLLWMQEAYRLTEADRVLQKTPFSFDVSVWEFFWPLITGSALVVAKPQGHQDPRYLAELISRQAITTVHFVPPMLESFLHALDALPCPTLKRIICSGEALPSEVQQRCLRQLGQAALHNLYGPTEASVDVTFWQCQPNTDLSFVPIGRPIANTQIYLLDARLQPVPVGVPGELYIAGAGLARGYLQRPGLSAARFLPNPFSPVPGARMYRSGDLARYLPDGNIEFLGRLDHQVKIRGFRIELGEIEAALGALPAVREAVVVAREDAPGDKRLVAYVLGEQDAAKPAVAQLRLALQRSLPEYMIPAHFVLLEQLPLTPNGKVDRKALPAPDAERSALTQAYVEPRNPIEETLARLWAEVLGIERVGVHDNFFELGGDSIRAVVLVNRIQKIIGEIVHVIAIFDSPTVASFARYIGENYSSSSRRAFGWEENSKTDNTAYRIAASDVAQVRQLIEEREVLSPAGEKLPKNPRAVFVLSPPRSGSTLLRVMLAGHPKLFSPPELELLYFDTLRERSQAFSGSSKFWREGLIRAVMELRQCTAEEATSVMSRYEENGASIHGLYREIQRWVGDRLLIDKTPSYSLRMSTLRRAEAYFDGPLYLHLTRHPYGMIKSFDEAKLDQIFFRHPHTFTRLQLAEIIWLVSHQNILDFLDGVPPERQLRVRFEDLVAAPDRTMEEICGFLKIEMHQAVLQPYEGEGHRMVDGIYEHSKMLGDVKFLGHKRIDPDVAQKWEGWIERDFLGDVTWETSERLGYEKPNFVGGGRSLLRIVPVRRGGDLPLSFAQQRLWFLDQFQPGNASYNIPAAVRLSGELELAALARALNEIVRRHESLRTCFHSHEGRPVQVIAPELEVALPLRDISHLPQPEREAQALRLAEAEAMRAFDLASGPLIRTGLIRLGERDHIILVTLHHIVSDGWSMGILMKEFAALYNAYAQGLGSPLPELELHYADFAQWQRQWLQGEVLERQVRYWKEQLAGAPAVLELPTDRARPALQSYRGATLGFRLARATCRGLRALAQQAQATLFMTLAAAFNVLLYRYSGQDDICIGTPIAGRNRVEIEPLVGFFVNTLVLRTRLQGNARFEELLQQVRHNALQAYAHQDVPFEHLVDVLKPERHASHAPLFQVMFALQNAPMERFESPGLVLQALPSQAPIAKFDLTLSIEEGPEELLATLEYNSDLFHPDTIARMAGHFQALLEAILADPAARIGELGLLTQDEHRQVLVQWNDTARDYAQEPTLGQLFEAQVERSPDAIALVFGEQGLSYAELNARANRLAHQLRRLGVGPDVRVGLCLERSLEMVIGLLGVLKAGGAYVPLDPAYPKERLAYMLQDAQPAVLLTQGALRERLPEAGQIFCLDTDARTIAQQPSTNPIARASTADLAYVIYTSGSTGQPKGVMGTHRATVNRLHWMWTTYPYARDEVASHKTTLSFVDSVAEIFAPLLKGVPLAILPQAVVKDLPVFIEALAHHNITRMVLVPSLLKVLLETEPALAARLPRLRHWVCSGERLSADLARRFQSAYPEATLLNLYGASEVAADATWHSVTTLTPMSAAIPIGHPIANTTCYVLDAAFNPVPVGVPGELYVGGECLARGYLNRPGLTAERFLPNPFDTVPGARMYKTGDLARYLSDGNIEFLGRRDHQVKIRGFRIELGEIEAAMGKLPAVREVVVLAREDASGDRRLVAYVVTHDGKAKPAVSDLRAALQQRLPEYMIPAHFVLLEQLPLTPNGKVDRKALQTAKEFRAQQGTDPVPPRTETERHVAEIWREVLGVKQIGVHDNFFALGGHSLSAMQVVAKLKSELQKEISVRSLFDSPTVAEIAAAVEAGERPRYPVIEPTAVHDYYPLSHAQKRIWFLMELDPQQTGYNVPAAVRLKGHLDVDALKRALQAVVERHGSLRTTFIAVDEQPMQWISEGTAMALPTVDLRSLDATTRGDELRRQALQEAQTPFNLETGPLMRAKILHLDDAEYALLVTMHHIVSDGWSMEILIKEVGALYAAFRTGHNAAASALPALPVQYADYALWQNALLESGALKAQRDYWLAQLGGELPTLQLPTDRPRPAVQTFNGDRAYLTVDEATCTALYALCRRHNVTLFMLLMAAYQVFLSKLSGQDDVIVGTPIAGRHYSQIAGLIGFFVNTLALRADLSADPEFSDLLKKVRETILQAYAHQDYPFDLLVDDLDMARDLSRQALFTAMFVFQNTGGVAASGGAVGSGLSVEPLPIDFRQAKFDLTLRISEAEHGLSIELEHNTDLFDAQTIRRWIGYFHNLLQAIVASPATRLSALPLLTDQEVGRLLHGFNPAETSVGRGACLHRLFEAQARRAPEAPALVFEDERLSYRELNSRANQLAHYLGARGVGPEVLVAVCLERSALMVVAILGILKAGGAYVPIDPEYPSERIKFILEDTRAPLLLTHSDAQSRVPDCAGSIICLDRERSAIAACAESDPVSGVKPDDLVYVIYTSGSTGKPKGTLLEHRNVARLLAACQRHYAFASSDVWTLFHSYCFDFSVWEIFGALLFGGKLVVVSKLVAQSPTSYLALLEEQRVTVLNQTPSVFARLLDVTGNRESQAWGNALRYVIFGGEALDLGAIRPWFSRRINSATRLVNMYGITETTVHVTYRAIGEKDLADSRHLRSVGQPLADLRCHILDRRMNPVPVGVVGELHVGGAGLARGYLNRAGLTAEKFVPDPFSASPGERLYRTGDLARYLPDGDIEFLGRIDHQVKIRGFRIELGEIETALNQHSQISDCVVVAVSDRGKRDHLVAYYAADKALPVSALRAFLMQSLPDYMLPSAFVHLTELPLTPNGKVDRKALVYEHGARPELGIGYVEPRNDIEARLVTIWREVLDLDRVGVHDNFFDLGGESFSAYRLMARISEEFHKDLPLVRIFEAQTVELLAAKLVEDMGEHDAQALVTIQQGAPERLPFFCVHPAGGDVVGFQHLARELGQDQPFYGFQSLGRFLDDRYHASLEEMARHYIQAIFTIQPEGPYLIGGHSLGGVIAFEMARQLEEMDKEIGVLAVFDAEVMPRNTSLLETLLLVSDTFGLKLSREDLGKVEGTKMMDQVLMRAKKQFARVLEIAYDMDILPRGFRTKDAELFFNRIATNIDLAAAYVPRPIRSKITLFLATELSEHGTPLDLEAWKPLSLSGLELIPVPGNHLNMVKLPHVRTLAAKLREMLNRISTDIWSRNEARLIRTKHVLDPLAKDEGELARGLRIPAVAADKIATGGGHVDGTEGKLHGRAQTGSGEAG